jgi:malate dehydrogenase (oxaloacetate-decarboxylating)
MKRDAIVFALANPTPEVMPEDARAVGARVIATGRSDFPNQVNNVLAFPGLFRGLLDSRKTHLTIDSELAASKAIAQLVETPTIDNILPDIFDERVVKAVSEAVKNS